MIDSKAIIERNRRVKSKLDEATDDKKKSVRDGITNQARGGTWMEPHHVASTVGHDDRTNQFYANARRASDPVEQEYWLARVFNNHSIAKNMALKTYAKEMASMTQTVGDIDDLMNQDDPQQSRGYRVVLKDEMRDPEDIAGDNETVSLLYQQLGNRWPNRPAVQMVLTYILIRGNNAHNIKKKLPYYDNVMRICDKIEADGKNWLTSRTFFEYAGISRTLYYSIVEFMNDVVKKIT